MRLLISPLVPCTLLLVLQVAVKRHWSKLCSAFCLRPGVQTSKEVIEPDTTLSGRLAFVPQFSIAAPQLTVAEVLSFASRATSDGPSYPSATL